MEGTYDCFFVEPNLSGPRTMEKSRAVEGVSGGSNVPPVDHARHLQSNLAVIQRDGWFHCARTTFVGINLRRRLPRCEARPRVQKIFPRSKIPVPRSGSADRHVSCVTVD